MPDVNSGRTWTPTGRPAKNGPMVNWQMWQAPRRRLKKGAPNEPPGRDLQGNRNALRPASRPGSGFRSCGVGGAAAGSAACRARTRTAAKRRHQRSCGPGTTLLLRSTGPVSWPSPEDVRKRAGPSAFGAGILSLCTMRKRILPARSRSAVGIVFAHTWSYAHDRQHGGTGEL